MSHQPERKEKNCLNCGTIVAGRYCQVCGQENIVNRQSFFSLIKHFIFDIFHFDGKFFETLKYLLFRPGFVPRKFIDGKRISYLDPIRMYLFTSAIFFLVFFSIKTIPIQGDANIMSKLERFEESAKVSTQLQASPHDSSLQYKLRMLLDTSWQLNLVKLENRARNDSYLVEVEEKEFLFTPRKDSSTFKAFSDDDNWLERRIRKSWHERRAKYDDDDKLMARSIGEDFLHKLPYVLFISLPLFALILKLLFIRRKNFYYSDHAIFTLYHYIFSFILLLIFFMFDELQKSTGLTWISWIKGTLLFCWGLYLLLGMRNFYRQGWAKTIGKFLLLVFLAFIMISILFFIFLLISLIF